ncbi:MAG TPA: glycosyltransferase [Candidatus Coprenecus pullistercoris]|nr:glycosyltransferase [Candidatus Coprenecus pullistercoris]
MKAAILSCFPPFRGGISQFNTSLYEELSGICTVRAYNFKRQYPEFLFPGKTQYIEDSCRPPFEAVAVLDTANPLSYIRTARIISAWEPDLLLMRYWMPYFAPSQGYVARHMPRNCKVISILDNVIPHERHFFDRPLTSYYLKGHDGFVVLCNAVRDDLMSIMPDARYIVSPHPVYSNFGEAVPRLRAAQSVGVDPSMKTLLFFGLIREYKGLDILLEAFAMLDDSYQLIIAGEPYGSFERYRRLIDTNPNRSRIHLFDRFISDSEVADFFCASDLCVLPYRSATQSGISSIAYHFELPMITTAVGGLREMIGERGTGLVTDSISPEAVKEAVIRYFSDGSIRSGCMEAIRREKDRLSWKRFCTNLIDFYNTL